MFKSIINKHKVIEAFTLKWQKSIITCGVITGIGISTIEVINRKCKKQIMYNELNHIKKIKEEVLNLDFYGIIEDDKIIKQYKDIIESIDIISLMLHEKIKITKENDNIILKYNEMMIIHSKELGYYYLFCYFIGHSIPTSLLFGLYFRYWYVFLPGFIIEKCFYKIKDLMN
jgi:fibrillarin-like rRNA methylase